MRYCSEKGIPHDEWLSWEPESRAKQIAFLIFDSQTCQLCGTAEWEWEENRFAYEPDEHFCRGCYMKEVAGENKNALPGTSIELVASTDQRRIDAFLAQERRRNMDFTDQESEQE